MTIRVDDKKKIESFLDGTKKSVLVLYGRKGMGKSTLLRDVVENRGGVMYASYSTTKDMQLSMLKKCINNSNSEKTDNENKLTLEDVIDLLIDETSNMREKNKNDNDKLSISFKKDEIENGSSISFDQDDVNNESSISFDIDKNKNELPIPTNQDNIKVESSIPFIIDNYADFAKSDISFNKGLSMLATGKMSEANIKLIICFDSYVNAKKMIFDRMSPWNEELTEYMEVKELSFRDSYAFFGEVSGSDAVFLYGLTGGIPAYLDILKKSGFDSRLGAVQRCFDESRRISTHPEEVLNSELRELAYYNRMLSTLASGKTRVNEISEDVGKPKDIVVPYLKTLISFNIVKKENPVTEKGNRRKTRYSIVNSSDVFWYRFMAPEYSLISNNEKIEVEASNLEAYEKEVFLQICAQYLKDESENGRMPFEINEIGNWWENDEENHTTEEFDLVGLGKSGESDASVFCNCFYSNKMVEIVELKSLIELTKHVKRRGDNFYMIFSKNGFSDHALTVASAIKNIILVDLDSIVKSYR